MQHATFHENTKALASEEAEFVLLHDTANRNLIIAKGPGVHTIVAEAVTRETGEWLVACLTHGAPHAHDTLFPEGEPASSTVTVGG